MDILELVQKNGGYVNYEMFGAKGDGVTDDIEAIKAAHDYANENNFSVKTSPTATYYVGPRPITAKIITSVDFNTSKFIIDDREVKLEERQSSVFSVVSKYEAVNLEIDKLHKNQMKLKSGLGYNAYVIVHNAEKKQFIRHGLNQNAGSAQTDSFVMDGTGYILNKIIWDFEKITSAVAYRIDETPLTINGGIFTVIANQAESKYTYHNRNINVSRSNVTVENLTHIVEGELDHGAPYGGFLSIGRAAYVTVRNCFFTARKIYQTIGSAGLPVSMGSYSLTIGNSAYVNIINVRQYNIMDTKKWGLMASNHCKDLYFDGCLMSRFDAHENVANLTIKNTTLGHQCFNAIGHGLMYVENVMAYGHGFMNLRGDYGSTWDGDVVFKNCTWYPNANAKAPSIIGGGNKGSHDFGFPCYIPHRVTIDGFTICDGDAPEGYIGASVFSNNMNEDITNFSDKCEQFPYFFTEQLSVKNVRTESGKGLKIFSTTYDRCFCTEKAEVNGENIVPNFRAKYEDVEMPQSPIIPQTNLKKEDFNGTYHLVAKLELVNCRDVVLGETSAPVSVNLTDCTTKN